MLPKIIRSRRKRVIQLKVAAGPQILGFAIVTIVLALCPFHASGQITRESRLITPSEGLAIVDTIADQHRSLNRHRSKPDCSHLVNNIYELAGFPYSYAKSLDLYRGQASFVRVSVPQPGDLIVWRGHVGLVVDPRNHFFYSSLRTGLETEDYTSAYWRRRGVPRFYRYRIANDESYVTARRTTSHTDLEGSFKTVAMSASNTGDDAEQSLEESRSSESLPPSPRTRGDSPVRESSDTQVDVSKASTGILSIAAKNKPTIDLVDKAIAEMNHSLSTGLSAESLLRSRSTVVMFHQFRVGRVELKGKHGWAYIGIDSDATLTAGVLNKLARHDEQRWEMDRVKSGWTLVVPSENFYLPTTAAIRIFAQQLAQLADRSESDIPVSSAASQESHLASLLSSLLDN